MKKLINGNIELNKNDIRVLKEEDHIEVHLKNKEKAIHKMNGEQWGHYNEDGDAYFGDHDDVIGYMNLYTQLKSNGVEIEITNIEIRPEYRGTIVFRAMFNEFEKYVDYQIDNYGPQNVIIGAKFENPNFKAFIYKWANEKGVKVEEYK